MKYKFKGYPKPIDNFGKLFFEHGKVYDLKVEEYFCGKGYMKGEMAPVVIAPYKRKYVSWKMFYKDWELVKDIQKNEVEQMREEGVSESAIDAETRTYPEDEHAY